MKYNSKLIRTQETKYITLQERGIYNHIRIYKTVHGLTVSVITGHGDYIKSIYNLKVRKIPALVRELKLQYMAR